VPPAADPAADPAAGDGSAPEGAAQSGRSTATPEGAERAAAPKPAPSRSKGSSGRVRHDEKITVYVTSDELHELESTRLALRRDHGLAVDRGQLVREAITLALEAVEAEGEDSPLVRRLRAR
jgi:hypothetical protein